MKITEFDIILSDETILNMLEIEEGREEDVRKRLHEILPEAYEKLQPVALLTFGETALYAVLTVGEEISVWSRQLFDQGNYLGGLLADTIANAYLWAMDDALGDTVVSLCKERGKGIASRLEAGNQMPIFMQKKILEVTDAKEQAGVTIKDSMMLEPIKTMGQIYLLNDDTSVYQNCHTCEGCGHLDCPSRKV